jgi:hypothetical protein
LCQERNMSNQLRRRQIPCVNLAIVTIALLLLPVHGYTADRYWVGGNGATWSSANGWSATPAGPGQFGPPGDGDTGYITQWSVFAAGSEIIGDLGTTTLYHSGGLNNINDYLYLGYGSTGNGLYLMQGVTARLYADKGMFVGYHGNGTFDQTNGAVEGGQDSFVYVGYLGGTGHYDISAGSLTTPEIFLGAAGGSGSFYVSGGTVVASLQVSIGAAAGGSGSFGIGGTGQLAASMLNVGDYGSGLYGQVGGTTAVKSLTVGGALGSNGTFNLIGGTVIDANLSSGTEEIIGHAGTGTFNQTGGINKAKTLYVGGYHTPRGDGSNQGNGTYNLGGDGTLISTNQFVGFTGTGNIFQTGGSNSAQALYLGYNTGGQGRYTQSGGTNTVLTDVFLGYGVGTYGIYDLEGTGRFSAGTVYAGFSGGGSINQDGGYGTIRTDLYLGYNANSGGTYVQTGGRMFLGNDGGSIRTGSLYLGYLEQSEGYYQLIDGELHTPTVEYVGHRGVGTFIQSGGLNETTALSVGHQTTGNGTYTLNGGQLTAYVEYVGFDGRGTFTQRGGSNTLLYPVSHPEGGSLFLGYQENGHGTYTLTSSAQGVLSSLNTYVGYRGTGDFIHNGGTHAVGNLIVGAKAGGVGTYTLESGGNPSLEAVFEHIGEAGTGSFLQTGGRNAVARTLFLGFMAGGSGTYELRGGTLTAGNIYVGGPGTGTFNQSGGTSTVTETLFVGGTDPGSGTFNMSWGALQAGNIVIMSSGAFNINGGSVVAPVTNYGTVAGAGTFTGDVVNYGRVNPGSSPGILMIDGNYTQDILGVLAIDIAGLLRGPKYDPLRIEYDLLLVTGTATLDGSLEVSLLNGFDPLVGSIFNILHADSGIFGTFAFLDLPALSGGRYWDIAYDFDDIFLSVRGGQTPVPEPSTILLLSGSLAALALFRIRK